uniref:Uncharacterized protein n=1 Tax=Rhizophora mucronata TaxID=61149 RepID=A0A2P2PRE1_RHIMU
MCSGVVLLGIIIFLLVFASTFVWCELLGSFKAQHVCIKIYSQLGFFPLISSR